MLTINIPGNLHVRLGNEGDDGDDGDDGVDRELLSDYVRSS